MSVIKKMRKQKAVWWARSSGPDSYGQFTFADPVEIDCRWDDNIQEFIDPKGQVTASQAVVYPDRILSVGDRLRRGPLGGGLPGNPLTLTDAFSIKRFDQTPNFKATETLYTAYL